MKSALELQHVQHLVNKMLQIMIPTTLLVLADHLRQKFPKFTITQRINVGCDITCPGKTGSITISIDDTSASLKIRNNHTNHLFNVEHSLDLADPSSIQDLDRIVAGFFA